VKNAATFYEGKIKDLASNIQSLETIVQNKTQNLRVVEEGKYSSKAPDPRSTERIKAETLSTSLEAESTSSDHGDTELKSEHTKFQ
jgi:hypothetical protein